ncbi:GerAB/ArcD/ProY family transporter [Bacillus sp. ISL-40]|uniref:GerAB/ArcD/ProY family transporter n=1 Tax=unclassified Bacillus (in: firmicutes) TaxID=185979 RepID=UPI001BE9E0B2|nr:MULTISPECIES: GerAB/ArcD/ProY family transporter [unclassified Bacillus (in: firmicutes)]MBT2696296.1 GerAB/ArcD/ProY family transporter [Bacillus sp. ISL-40]MBT2720451.1 GerAB/ArcD/ProY family transporter [Bacillus sp. ISL-46]MBT2743145.1 GerAB/ArcD/ProY family transporter [Bacillus sp. ISL-77]
MEKAKINATQLFVLVVLFEMGSAILVGIASDAKQDAWIAILLGLTGGIMIFFIYYKLYMYYPDLPLTSYVQEITGKWLGRLIGFLYIVYFMYLAARVLRDFGELLTSTIYNSTPLFVINTLMIITIIYGIHKGFEVIARVGEIYFGVVYLTAILGMLLITFSGLIHLGNLKPILENGLKPVIKTFLTQTINFPFGEMVVFTMLLPFVNDKKKVKIVCLSGMILSGINITITVVVNISVLGVNLFSQSTFPLLTTVGKIQIADFIERLDVLFMLYLIIGGFFKIAIYYYAAVAGAADIFQLKNQRKLGFPLGIIVLFASVTIASNYSEHIKEGLVVVPTYLHWPFQIIIPSMLLIIAFFRNRKKKKSPS